MAGLRFSILSGLLGLMLLPSSRARADEKEEALARGPIHEAFAEPVDSQLSALPVVPKQPPAPIDELPPDQRPVGDNVQWIPGYWHFEEERKDFIWISGFWRVPPPNRTWMPGSWRESPDGWQWAPGLWSNSAQPTAEVQYLPEPPKSVENGPATPAPTATAVYVPGVYVYRDGRYLWRAGYWAESKVGWIWIAPHYRWTPVGYIFVDGYWDHPLGDRGMLFAPVYIPPDVYLADNYYYSPTIVVREQCMYGALFVRRGYGCYYFGDYFEPRYAEVGYVSWGGYRGGREVVMVGGFYDPMYSYYRVTYRDDPYWRTGVTEIYVGRYRGDIAPPPRTLVQQNVVINNITINNTTVNNINVNNSRLNNASMLTPLSQASKTTSLKLQAVPLEGRQQHLQAARHMNAVAVRRGQMETKLLNTPNRAPNAPRTLKMDLPKPAPSVSTAHNGAVHPTTGTALPMNHISPTSGTASGVKLPSGSAVLMPSERIHPGTVTPTSGTALPGHSTAPPGHAPPTGTRPPVHTPPAHIPPAKEKEKEKHSP